MNAIAGVGVEWWDSRATLSSTLRLLMIVGLAPNPMFLRVALSAVLVVLAAPAMLLDVHGGRHRVRRRCMHSRSPIAGSR
jgi:hypothetical protein